MDEDHDYLEVRAYLAMQGAGGAAGRLGDWRNDVAAALRSDAPLSPEFREVLAQIINGGRHGWRLELVADNGEKKRRQDQFGGWLIRMEWAKIGKWMDEEVAAGSSRTDAISGAAERFAASREKCDAALVYFHRLARWLGTDPAGEGSIRKVLDDDRLASLFHSKDAAGKPLDSK